MNSSIILCWRISLSFVILFENKSINTFFLFRVINPQEMSMLQFWPIQPPLPLSTMYTFFLTSLSFKPFTTLLKGRCIKTRICWIHEIPLSCRHVKNKLLCVKYDNHSTNNIIMACIHYSVSWKYSTFCINGYST